MPKLTFLYIEDDVPSQKVMKFFLEEELGINLIIFSDTDKLAARLEALDQHIELVFVDIHIQPLDGFEVLQILRTHERLRQSRIIAITASVMNEEVAQLRGAGFDGCIAKPLNYTLFPRLVARILANESIWQVQ